MSRADEIVVLLPGLMGFDQLRDFHYFSQRGAAMLQALLWRRLGRTLPVIPLATRPMASLAARQRWISGQLSRWLERYGRPSGARVHLVGHSTGGVDAWLLACGWTPPDTPVDAAFDPAHPLGKHPITTVTALSAPFYGAGIVRSPAWQLIHDFPCHQWRNRAGYRVLGKVLAALATRPAGEAPGIGDLLLNAGLDAGDLVRLLGDAVRDRDLIVDLEPRAIAGLRATLPVGGRSVHCFVSVAPPPRGGPKPPGAPPGWAPSLYEVLHQEIVRDEAQGGFDPQVDTTLEQTRQAVAQPVEGDVPVIGDPTVLGRCAWDQTTSDGIVNSGAMLPAAGGVLAGVVVGDHADVIGHYDRTREPLGGSEGLANYGLLASGAGFDDAAFVELWGRIADVIAPRAASGASSPAPNAPQKGVPSQSKKVSVSAS